MDISDLAEPGDGEFGFVLVPKRGGLPAGSRYVAKIIQLSDNSGMCVLTLTYA